MLLSITNGLLLVLIGCTQAKIPGEYRESQGSTGIFSVEQSDNRLKFVRFVKLEDGTVINPIMYRYPAFRKIFDPPRELRVRSSQITSVRGNKKIRLPISEEITSYLLLVRNSVPAKIQNDGTTQTMYEWSDWQLLEIDAKEVSLDKPIVIPPFEELLKREISDEQEELLKDLVQKYDKIVAAARKKVSTPVPPRKTAAGQDQDSQPANEKKIEQEEESDKKSSDEPGLSEEKETAKP